MGLINHDAARALLVHNAIRWVGSADARAWVQQRHSQQGDSTS